jgi:hypothetical protein
MTITACGEDDVSRAAGVPTLEITAGSKGALTVPKRAAPGVIQLTLRNKSKGDAEAQLIRIEGDHSRSEVLDALGRAVSAKPWKDFLFAAGGVGMTDPGDTRSATQELEAGTTYYVFNASAESQPQPSDLHKIEISGDEEGALPETNATVSATDHGYTADGLTSGRNEVTFENAGREPHHLLLGQLRKGATIADAKRFLLSDTDSGSGPFPACRQRSGDERPRARHLPGHHARPQARQIRPLLLRLRPPRRTPSHRARNDQRSNRQVEAASRSPLHSTPTPGDWVGRPPAAETRSAAPRREQARRCSRSPAGWHLRLVHLTSKAPGHADTCHQAIAQAS